MAAGGHLRNFGRGAPRIAHFLSLIRMAACAVAPGARTAATENMNQKSKNYLWPSMATLPQTDSPIVSAELRGQFNGLKDLIDQAPDMTAVDAAIAAGSAPLINVATYDVPMHDPPTFDDVEGMRQKLNELITALTR